jgi:Asp-tRNA(Asn)/Glu-tRNA(Gln) amidotransferase A subunit family amidase
MGVGEVLAAIGRLDPVIGAFTATDPGAVTGVGPLAGMPVAVKEVFAVRGLPWTAGSLTRRDVVADTDAAAVAALRAAGAAIVGVTRSHEFAWGLPTWHEVLGGPRNPWDTTRITGGSSGGSAAAVAAGLVPAALGTDTGCSIRLPAAFCGVVGFKPTHGRISTDGAVPLSPSLDHVGVLAAEVEVAARVAAVLGVESGAPVEDLDGLVVGVGEPPQGLPLPADRAASVTAAVTVCRDLGARIVPVRLPPAEDVAACYAAVQAAEAAAVHVDELGIWPARRQDYGSDVRERMDRAVRVDLAGYRHGIRLAVSLRERAAALLAGVDLLLTPVAACAPGLVIRPHDVEVAGRPVPLRDAVLPYTQWQNVCGLPACAVPAGVDAGGLPVGVQVTGRPWADGLVLGAAGLLQARLRARLPAAPPVSAGTAG